MGLTIAHKIVKDHNGTIKVKSEPGKGTVFNVELPLVKFLNNKEKGFEKRVVQK